MSTRQKEAEDKERIQSYLMNFLNQICESEFALTSTRLLKESPLFTFSQSIFMTQL